MNESTEPTTDEPLQLPKLSRVRAIAGSLGLFGVTGLVWALITMAAPNFFASSESPFTYLVVIGIVLLLFGGLVTGQIRAVRAWFGSLAETDGVRKRTVNRLRFAVSILVVVSLVSGVAIFLFNQLVWLPEVRKIVGDG